MVLVFYILDNCCSILQTKFSYREGHEARRVGLEAVPLDQHIEGRHGEREARVEIGPAPVHDLLQMADERQHGEHGLHQHARLTSPCRAGSLLPLVLRLVRALCAWRWGYPGR